MVRCRFPSSNLRVLFQGSEQGLRICIVTVHTMNLVQGVSEEYAVKWGRLRAKTMIVMSPHWSVFAWHIGDIHISLLKGWLPSLKYILQIQQLEFGFERATQRSYVYALLKRRWERVEALVPTVLNWK